MVFYERRAMDLPFLTAEKPPEDIMPPPQPPGSLTLRGISKVIARTAKAAKPYEFKGSKAADIMNTAIMLGPVYRNK